MQLEETSKIENVLRKLYEFFNRRKASHHIEVAKLITDVEFEWDKVWLIRWKFSYRDFISIAMVTQI
jgi:hypothetical protein